MTLRPLYETFVGWRILIVAKADDYGRAIALVCCAPSRAHAGRKISPIPAGLATLIAC